MLTFYTSTFEEYYTGKLVLPIINGPSEGLLMGASLSFVSGIWGQDFWHGTEFYDQVAPFLPSFVDDSWIPNPVKNYDIIVFLSLACLTKEVMEKVVFVVRGYGLQSLRNFLPIVLLLFYTFALVAKDPAIFWNHERLCFHYCACIFVDMTTNLMLDHMTKKSYNPYRICLAPLVFLGFNGNHRFLTESQVDIFLWASAIITVCYVARNIVCVIDDICKCLGIWCFDIVTPYPKIKKS